MKKLNDAKILEFISEKYKNFSSLTYDQIIEMCEVGKPLHGMRNDVIGNASDCLFFVGQRKGSPETESIFEYSRIDHKINVLAFCYLQKTRTVKKVIETIGNSLKTLALGIFLGAFFLIEKYILHFFSGILLSSNE